MAKRRAKSQTARRSGKNRKNRERVRVYEAPSGLQVIQSGLNTILDRSNMAESQRVAFEQAMIEHIRALPQAVADDVESVREFVGTLPTLPLLVNVAFQTFPHDADTHVEANQTRIANQVEWVTGLTLRLHSPIPVDPTKVNDYPEQFQEFLDTLDRLYDNLRALISSRPVKDVNRTPSPLDLLKMQSMMHELNVRSLVYPHQRKALLHQLFDPFSPDLVRILGFDAADALDFTEQLMDLVNAKMMALAQEIVSGKNMAMEIARTKGVKKPPQQEQVARGWMAQYAWMVLDSAHTVTPDELNGDLAKSRSFLKHFSRSFGQLGDPDPGPDPDVRAHPLVELDGPSYLCHLLPVLDEAFKTNFEDALKSDPVVWSRYERHRAGLLEDLTVTFLRKAMPAARLWQNLKYTIRPGENGELDILCQIDRTLLLCECKAGTLTPPVRQGARLRRALQEILGKAHEQAIRASKYIEGGLAVFSADDGSTLTVNKDDYDRTFLVLVTLEGISAFTTNMAYCVGAGITGGDRIPWAVSLPDLELIADLVDLNVMLPHYIMRRARIAKHEHFLAMEEMDWFMHYLDQGLYFGDDLSKVPPTRLLSFTGILDDYYLFTFGSRTKPAPKPSLKLQTRYRELIEEVEASGIPGWLEGAILLIEYGDPAREWILRHLRILSKRTAPTGRALTGSPGMIALYAEPATLKLLQDHMVAYAKARMVTDRQNRCLVIGFNPRYPVRQFSFLRADADALPSLEEAECYLEQFSTQRILNATDSDITEE